MPGPIRAQLTAEEFSEWKRARDAEKQELARIKEQERQADIEAGRQQLTGLFPNFVSIVLHLKFCV